MMDTHQDEFRRLFALEAAEQLERLADTGMQLERSPEDPELVATLFRDAHTLKSSAALVGLPEVAQVAHELEDLLGELRTGRRTASPALVDGVLGAVDALAGLVEAGLAGRELPAVVAAGQEALRRAAGAEAPGAGMRDDAEPPPASPDPPPEDDERLRRVFSDEVAPVLERLTRAALELERRGAEAVLVAALFRDVHTLKGSAAVVGFHAGAELVHRLEDRMGELRAGTRQASPAFVDAMLAVLDAIRAATPALLAGEDTTAALEPGHTALDGLERSAGATPARQQPPVGPSAAVSAGPPAGTSAGTPLAAPAAAPPSDVVRLVPVGIDRLDRLVRLSGEAVTAYGRLTHVLGGEIAADPEAEAAALQLRRVLAGTQEQTLRTRMTTLEAIAGSLRRAVRDVARSAGKEVDYELDGERVELDRAVLDGLRDPLLHLVRNAVDHGLEPTAERQAAGKPRAGTVRVTADRRGPEVVLTITDDGRGLDLDALRATAGESTPDEGDAVELAFRAGVSTARAVTDVSGRGVGLDAVRSAVRALRGRVDVHSTPGVGCVFTIAVPLTLAVVACVLVEAQGQRYHLPTHATRLVSGAGRDAEVAVDGGRGLWIDDDVVAVTDLADALGAGSRGRPDDGPVIVLEGAAGARHGFRLAAVLGQRDVTVEELGGVVPAHRLVAGASIEPDGSVVLVLDVPTLIDAAARAPGRSAVPAGAAGASVLVVDDALTMRELQRSILEGAGHTVRVAVDGRDALARLAEEPADLVITDVEMPRMDGFALVRTIRATSAVSGLPVLMVTSRTSDEDRRRGLAAGADAYLVKRDFDEHRLLDAVDRLLGRP